MGYPVKNAKEKAQKKTYMNGFQPNILIIIPVYNNQKTLRGICEILCNMGLDVLVVDDGSMDGSIESISGLNVHVVMHPFNMGKGRAIITGAEWAKEHGFKNILTMDGDGQHDPNDIKKFIDYLASNPDTLIIGTRDFSAPNIPDSSRFGRVFSNFWIKVESGIYIPDTQSGYRLYPVDLLLKLKLRAKRYNFEIEVITKAIWADIPVKWIDVNVTYPETSAENQSSFRPFVDNLRISITHTMLCLRALMPIPHRKLIKNQDSSKFDWSLFHPVKLFKRLLSESTTPYELGLSAALGIFLGALPLIACHTAVIIYVAVKWHLNKIIAVGVSTLCAPPFVPVAAIELGHFMRKGEFIWGVAPLDIAKEVHVYILDWFLGSLIIGPVLGIAVGGGLAWFRMRRLTTASLESSID